METPTKAASAASKLSTMLATASFLLIAVVLLLYGGVKTYHEVKTQEAVISSEQQLIARDAARTVSGFINENFNILETANVLTNLYAVSEAQQRQVLRSLLGIRSGLRRVVLLDTRNQIQAQASRLSMEAPSQLMDQLKDIKAGQTPQEKRKISPVYIDFVTSEPMVSLAIPVTDTFGDFRGTLIAELNLKSMWDIVDQLKVGKTGYVYVSDRVGNLLAFQDTARVLRVENVSSLKAVADFIKNHASIQPSAATRYQGIMGSTVVGTYAPLKSPDWAVVTELPWEEAYREVVRNIATTVGLTLAMAILAGIFGVFVAKRLAVPVINLTETASRIAAGERDLQATVGGPREVGRLATAFNSMTAQLRQSNKDLEQRFADLKQTQEALRLSEERLRLALEGTSDGIWDWNLETGQVYFSPRYYSMVGYEPNEFPAAYESWRQLLHPDDVEPSERAVQRAIEAHSSFAIEFRFKAKNGEWRWILGRGKVGESEVTGKAFRLAGSHTDITERKRAEEELRKYEHIVSSTTDLMSFIDKGYVYQAVNKTYLQAHDRKVHEIVGHTVAELHGSDVFNSVIKGELDGCFAGERISYQAWFDYAGLGRRFMDVVYSPYVDASGEISGVVVTCRDTTERMRAEEKLRQLQTYLANIIDSMPSVLVGVDMNGRVTQWNAAAERLTGIQAQAAQGRPLEQVLPMLNPEMEKVRRTIRDRAVRSEIKVPRNVDGETRYDDVTVFPLMGNGVEGAVIRVDDVTERVRIEEMMVQSEKMLSVGGLAAGMAHEINNPLGTILQASQNMLRRVSPDLPANARIAEECGTTLGAVRKYLEKREITVFLEDIRNSGLRAAQIVENMLTFSRKPDAEGSSTNLAELLDRTLLLAESDYDLKKRYDFRQIKIVREYHPDVPPVVCQASKIQQVFLNILRNGAEAMRETWDSGRVPRFVLRVLPGGAMVRVEIEDNGPGMDEMTRRRVFEPFFTTKPPGVGTGLGLSVSYFIVTQDHRGALSVQSQPGQGTYFIIELPTEGHVHE